MAILCFYSSQGVLVGKTLYVSGQIGMTLEGNLVRGIEAQTKLSLENLGHILNAAGISYNNGTHKIVLLISKNAFYFIHYNKLSEFILLLCCVFCIFSCQNHSAIV